MVSKIVLVIGGILLRLCIVQNSDKTNLNVDLFHMTSRRHVGVQNNETAALLVYHKNPLWLELLSDVKTLRLRLCLETCLAADHVSGNNLLLVRNAWSK